MSESDHSSGFDIREPWFAEWFNHPLYLQVYSHRDTGEAVRCIRTILDRTRLADISPSSLTVLDIACGAGRHALELARLGYSVTGNDLSPFLLDTARSEASAGSVELAFTCCDMRKLPHDNRFDLVVQLFTSFGYFDTEDDDRQVLANVHQALISGGWYVLDLINPLHLKQNLVERSCRTIGNLTVIEERSLTDQRITKTITITPEKGEPLSFTESVALFSEEKITNMLRNAGFLIDSIAGDYNGSAFDSGHSPRMMLFSRKP